MTASYITHPLLLPKSVKVKSVDSLSDKEKRGYIIPRKSQIDRYARYIVLSLFSSTSQSACEIFVPNRARAKGFIDNILKYLVARIRLQKFHASVTEQGQDKSSCWIIVCDDVSGECQRIIARFCSKI